MLILIGGRTAAGKTSISKFISRKIKKTLSSVIITTDHFYKTSEAPIDWDNPQAFIIEYFCTN